jgi:ABC-type Fe3+ transport system substrate-binding protein
MRLFAFGLGWTILAAAGPASALTPAEIARLAGPDRQAQLEAGAQAEGRVSLYTALIVDQVVRPLAAGFEARYPYLKLDYWRGESRSIVQKVLAERRAGALAADVIEGTGLADSLVEAGAVAPFASPELAGFDARYRDPRGLWAPLRFDYYGATVNTRLVPPASAPDSYDALLAPGWRGKIAWLADNESGALLLVTGLRLAWGEERARLYFERLAAQQPVAVTASARTLVNRVIEGEYPLALGVALHHAVISAGAGAPVAPAAMDPVAALLSIVMLGKEARHPHAAMLLIDFLLSRQGQTILRDRQYLTARGDVPPLDSMKAIVPRLSGHTELFIRPEDFSREHDASQALLERNFP